MKVLIATLLFLLGCSGKDDSTKVIALKNDLGTISLRKLDSFDTYHESFKLSDCGCCCREFWYSFVNSKSDNFPFSDTINYFVEYDSNTLKKHSLIISQPSCKFCINGDTIIYATNEEIKSTLRGRMNESALELKVDNFSIDTSIVYLDHHFFSILSYRGHSYDGKIIEALMANTLIKHEPVRFEFERIGSDSTDFIRKAYEIIQTIKIKD